MAVKSYLQKYEYMTLDDGEFEFGWRIKEVEYFDLLWNGGVSVWKIAKILKRDVDEVAILVIDRARKNKIEKRTGGVFGSVKD